MRPGLVKCGSINYVFIVYSSNHTKRPWKLVRDRSMFMHYLWSWTRPVPVWCNFSFLKYISCVWKDKLLKRRPQVDDASRLQQKRVSQQIQGIFGSRYSNNSFCFTQRTNYRNKTTLYAVHALHEAKSALLKQWFKLFMIRCQIFEPDW